MIDTIKIGIPLTHSQHNKLHKLILNENRWQWVQYNPQAGDLRFLRIRGLAELDKYSYHREIFWDIPDSYRVNNTFLVLEFSLPKYWYGHNIDLLYDIITVLNELKKLFEKQLHCKFSKVETWLIFRVDCCYAWKCPTQLIAQQVLDSLKHLSYPRKKPKIYPESIMFTGRTYSLKFYLKLPEFQTHDKKALLKGKANSDWINFLEQKASGILRCEATLRRQYLKTKNILVVGDLINSNLSIKLDEVFRENNPSIISQFSDKSALFLDVIDCILIHDFCKRSNISVREFEKITFDQYLETLRLRNTTNHDDFNGYINYVRSTVRNTAIARLVDDNVYKLEISNQEIHFYNINLSHNGGGLIIEKQSNPMTILNYFLKKFLGSNPSMQEADKIKTILLEKYKPVKAARLVGFWLYIQRFGSDEAKVIYGRDSYYKSKRELKEAGVSLIEPPKDLDNKFLDSFKFEIPSSYVVNQVDNFRDSSNIINLPIQYEAN
jgi:Phage replication protein CRI